MICHDAYEYCLKNNSVIFGNMKSPKPDLQFCLHAWQRTTCKFLKHMVDTDRRTGLPGFGARCRRYKAAQGRAVDAKVKIGTRR